MPNTTTHYKLTKPYGSEYFNVGTWNNNMDKIDTELWKVGQGLTARTVSYDDSVEPHTGFVNVQQAIDYLKTHAVGGGTAEDTTYNPAGNVWIDATNVQDAIDMIDAQLNDDYTTIQALLDRIAEIEEGKTGIVIKSVKELPATPEENIVYFVQGKVEVKDNGT